MSERSGVLVRNEIGRYEFAGVELTSGDLVEIEHYGRWVLGRVERSYWHRDYVLEIGEGANKTVISLCRGLKARLPEPRIPRYRG